MLANIVQILSKQVASSGQELPVQPVEGEGREGFLAREVNGLQKLLRGFILHQALVQGSKLFKPPPHQVHGDLVSRTQLWVPQCIRVFDNINRKARQALAKQPDLGDPELVGPQPLAVQRPELYCRAFLVYRVLVRYYLVRLFVAGLTPQKLLARI